MDTIELLDAFKKIATEIRMNGVKHAAHIENRIDSFRGEIYEMEALAELIDTVLGAPAPREEGLRDD